MTVKQNKGFSLLEVVVVVAIVGSIAALGNFGFRAADRGAVLNSATEQFITDFEQMRSNAINGVYIDPNTAPMSWALYINNSDNTKYKTGGDLNDYLLDAIEVIKTIKLPSNITILIAGGTQETLAFELFTGDFYYKGAIPAQYTTVTLTDANSGNSKTIAINQEGIIIEESICGDNKIQAPEQCDDGNTADGDGCSSGCIIEDICGNGLVETGEECEPGLPLQTTCGLLGLGRPEYADIVVSCDLTCNWDTVGICIGGGGGGGGCSISPYTPPDNNTHSSMLLYLLLAPIIIFGFKKQIGRVHKIKVYAKKR